MLAFPKSIALVRQFVEEKKIPSAALAIGVGSKLYAKKAFGVTSYTEGATAVNAKTKYDVASLTKIMATTMITLRYINDGKIRLEDTLTTYFGTLVPPDKSGITVFELLTHTAGFKATVLLEELLQPGDDPTLYILNMPLVYEPGTREIYSDLGFILLGKILERLSGETLDALAREEVFGKLNMPSTAYHPLDMPIDPSNTAYTERNHITGDWLCGQVDDENAYFMNGVAGNAGVFTDLDDMIVYAEMLANHGAVGGSEYLPRELFDKAIQNYTLGKTENRGLGFNLVGGKFDTMFAAKFLDPNGFGHMGFTGPSIIVSPSTGLYVALLNNRVHPTRENKNHLILREQLHETASIEYIQMAESGEEPEPDIDAE